MKAAFGLSSVSVPYSQTVSSVIQSNSVLNRNQMGAFRCEWFGRSRPVVVVVVSAAVLEQAASRSIRAIAVVRRSTGADGAEVENQRYALPPRWQRRVRRAVRFRAGFVRIRFLRGIVVRPIGESVGDRVAAARTRNSDT